MKQKLTEKQKIRKRWVAKLRSGEYKQGKGFLARKAARSNAHDRYCCLGVLCDMAVKAKIIPQPTESEEFDSAKEKTVKVKAYGFGEDVGSLPDEVVSWVGMASDFGNFNGEAGSDNLANMNDSGKIFKQIADIIESNPEGLFNEEV